MQDDTRSRPLQGAVGWLITDGKAGMQVQVRGVADALGLNHVHKQVAPRALHRMLSPWLAPAPSERLGKEGSLFAPPWPDIAIATGRLSIPYLRALARLAGPATFTVVLQDPKTGLQTADLIWVPAHDNLRGPNVITTPTSAHSFSQLRLAKLRSAMPGEIASLPSPRVAVLLGGQGGGYRFGEADIRRLAEALESLAALEVSFLVTPSRRTPERLLAAVDQATRGRPRVLWNGAGENPYPHFLACADILIVTADSVNMASEAAATGRPVYVFEPAGGSRKFSRFHECLRESGAARSLPPQFNRIETWSYRAQDAAPIIAAEIERRWLERHAGKMVRQPG